MPKEKKRVTTGASTRHAPLGQVMEDDVNRDKYASQSTRRKHKSEDNSDNEEEFMDEKTSNRILSLSENQLREEERMEQDKRRRDILKNKKDNGGGDTLKDVDSSDEEEEEEEEVFLINEEEDDDETEIRHDGGYVSVDGPGLSAEEEAVVASMMGNSGEERRTLADIILEKIAEKEAEGQQGTNPDDGEQAIGDDLPPKVVEVYTDIGAILSRYKAGKLPKAFKVIPSLHNWEEVLYLTRPDQWTPGSMYAATRIFASNLNPKMAQRFYNLVLLDAVRADICAEKKLNYHYYMALKKALYKPAAFFKGILLPLCQDNCTLREAAIVASVLQRVSIPVHHSAVAIHKLSQMEYSGAASIFIKTLLNKKYSLPAPVISSLVLHFTKFQSDKRVLPVLWHQALLTFVQRYKNEVLDEAREGLRLVMKVHYHPKITPEIRRELFGTQAWKQERELASGGNNEDMEM